MRDLRWNDPPKADDLVSPWRRTEGNFCLLSQVWWCWCGQIKEGWLHKEWFPKVGSESMGQGMVGTSSVKLLWNCLSSSQENVDMRARRIFWSRAVMREFFHNLECLDCPNSGLFCLIGVFFFFGIRLWKIVLELYYDMGASNVPGTPAFPIT